MQGLVSTPIQTYAFAHKKTSIVNNHRGLHSVYFEPTSILNENLMIYLTYPYTICN